MHSCEIPIENEAETRAFAKSLGAVLVPGDCLLLQGDLGAGKSALARALIRSLPCTDGAIGDEDIPSPTFTVVQTYERAVAEIWHFDLYRLSAPEELYEIGAEEAFARHISLIEWPDRLGHLKPEQFLEISISFGNDDEQRLFSLTGTSSWSERLVKLGTPE